MSFTFIHAADIHLDSPLTGLESYEGAPVDKIRSATRDAFRNLVDTAINRKVAFIILAGDIYDGDWKDYNTGLFFANQMARLHQENILVFLIRGNHDAASVITKELKLPNNVKEFPVNHPETIVIQELGVAIHGQGFASRSVEDNIVKDYPYKKDGYVNIGILHTSATGREGHEHYAPCSIEDMKNKGYDYWALGHIHMREILHEKNPTILFSGNIQGRHSKETGEKGCTLVSVEEGGIKSITHLSLDVLRWELLEISANGIDEIDELFESARNKLNLAVQKAEGRFLAVRFRIFGSTSIHQELIVNKEYIINNLRTIAFEVGLGDIWVEKVKVQTTQLLNLEELNESNTPLSFLLEYIDRVSLDKDELELLLGEFEDLYRSLPYELRRGAEGQLFSDTDEITGQLKEIKEIILYYLTNSEVEA